MMDENINKKLKGDINIMNNEEYIYRITMNNGCVYQIKSNLNRSDLPQTIFKDRRTYYEFELHEPLNFNTILINCEEISSIEYYMDK